MASMSGHGASPEQPPLPAGLPEKVMSSCPEDAAACTRSTCQQAHTRSAATFDCRKLSEADKRGLAAHAACLLCS